MNPDQTAAPPTSRAVQFLVYAMILAVLVVEYFHKTYRLPRVVALLPDLLSAIAATIVLAQMIANRFRSIDARYMVIFLLLLFNFVAGSVLNNLQPGIVVAGIRAYFSAILFFFLPLVVFFDDRALKKQLLLIATICLVQFPLAWTQRAATEASTKAGTGDYTFGTLMNSAILSVFLCCVAAVAMGLHLRRYISLRTLFLFLAVTLPATMINETKGTLFLIPIAFLAPVFLSGVGSASSTFKRAVVGISVLAVFIAAFIPVYDHYMQDRWGYGLIEFFQMEGRAERYLSKGAEIGSEERVGRIDSLTLPLTAAGSDVGQLAFGLGMGNLGRSPLGEGFEGEYYERYQNYIGPNLSLLLWETGILGSLLVFWLLYRIFKDTLVARHAEGLTGALAVGWCGVVMLLTLCMIYKQTMASAALSYLFWFYSGVMAAAATRVRQAHTANANIQRGVAAHPWRMMSSDRSARESSAR